MSEALVVGGGPAGAAVAIALARAGRQVVLVEKEATAHHKVCGEFLSAEALGYLHDLDVDAAALDAVPIDAVRMVRGQHVTQRALPFAAMSLSRHRLDAALLERAVEAGVRVMRGARVAALARQGDGWSARLANEHTLAAKNIFLCTGKHDLRDWRRPAGSQGELIAFKMHWRLAAEQQAELERCVELTLFAGGYGGMEPVEDGAANLCVLVRRARLAQLGGWDELLAAIRSECPQLDERLRGAVALWPRPLALSAIPYGYVCAQADGVWRLGDQAAVIPSFSGDGMSIALHSAQLAAKIFLAGGSAASFQQRMRRDVAHQVAFATAISKLLLATPAAVMAAIWLWPGAVRLAAVLTRVRATGVRRRSA